MKKFVTDIEEKEFKDFIRQWALKKMKRHEKKLKRYARIYFGEPMAIIYARNGAKIVHNDGSEGEIRV